MTDRHAERLHRTAQTFRALLDDDRGATAIEYVLILSLIFLVVIAAVAATGDGLGAAWSSMADKAVEAMNSVGG